MADLESEDLDKSGLSTWLWYSGPAVFVLGSLALAGLGSTRGGSLDAQDLIGRGSSRSSTSRRPSWR